MTQQLQLFPNTTVDRHFEKNIRQNGYDLREVDAGDITFQSGQSESVHRWYRLTPSFAPAVVRHFLAEFAVTASCLVLDPFSGRGTTAIECQKHGVPAVGFEINPLLHEVGRCSVIWRPQRSTLFARYVEDISRNVRDARQMDVHELLEETGVSLPDIHHVFRWWQPDVLKDLLVARETMRRAEFCKIRHYLWLAVNTAALDCANIHRNHPTITFDDDHDRKIDAAATIAGEVFKIQEDLESLTQEEIQHSRLASMELRNSCRQISVNGACKPKITHVITSPPYPNRFSYVHQTRPQLHFMELIQGRSAATDIDLETIGGTWGRATSNLMKGEVEVPPEIAQVLDYSNELRGKSRLMCNYATKYFLDLNTHLQELRKVVDKGFRGAYVVGNSRLSGVEIYTEGILAKLFESNGFVVDEIVVFRRRGGRQRLYECAVCVRI